MIAQESEKSLRIAPLWIKARAFILAKARAKSTVTIVLSILAHLLMLLILLLITYHLEKKEGLDLFLKLGEPTEASGALVADPAIFDPLEMPSVDVTKLEMLANPTTLSPDLPRLILNDLPRQNAPVLENPKAPKGFGLSVFDGVSEKVQGVSVKVGDPQFTLIWDTDADLDLHVIEPGGSEIYWEYRKGKQGGELDVDDVDGMGPENVYWQVGSGPRGQYTWWVHYYGGFGGKVRRTKWQVRIKKQGQVEVFEGVIGRIDEMSDRKTLRLN